MTPDQTSSATPSASAPQFTGFEYSDILRVEVNGLAVRVAPTLSSPLAQGLRDGVPTGEVRLNAGDHVSVALGPLAIAETVWYLVWPAEDARLMYSTVWWDTRGDNPDGGVDPAWVAASVGDDQYLTLQRRPDSNEYESWPADGPQTVMASGTGDYQSEPQVRHDMFSFYWAAAADDPSSPCALSVSLVPQDGGAPVLAVDTSTADVETGPTSGPDTIPETPWRPTAAGTWSSFTIAVKSDCTWAIRLMPLAHD